MKKIESAYSIYKEDHKKRMASLRNTIEFWESMEEPTPAMAIQSYCDLCACGTDRVGELLLSCLMFAEHRKRIDSIDSTEEDFLPKSGFYSNTATELGAKLLDSLGVFEHGGSIGFAWLSEEGDDLYNFLREKAPHQMNDFDWKRYFIKDD